MEGPCLTRLESGRSDRTWGPRYRGADGRMGLRSPERDRLQERVPLLPQPDEDHQGVADGGQEEVMDLHPRRGQVEGEDFPRFPLPDRPFRG